MPTGPYGRKQEVVNGLIHVGGILFGLLGVPMLIIIANAHGNRPGLIGGAIYGFSFLLVFTVSTIYHFSTKPAIKRMFKVFDHIGIYFFIAGSYTPFLLVYMNNRFGITLLVIVWALAVAGTFFKARYTGRMEIFSTILYLAMGWIMIAGGRRFFDQLPPTVLLFVCIGAALYTIGAFIYLWDKYKYTHAVWHAFVLTAALCHYVAVFLTM